MGAVLIQIAHGYSNEETVAQIRETPYLQFFCGLPGYEDKNPFDSSSMVYFRKRLTPEILGKINECIIKNASNHSAKKNEPPTDDTNDNPKSAPHNKGTLIVDATCALCHIKFMQDTELLNDSREKLEKTVDVLHDLTDGPKPRTYRQQAHKAHLSIARSKKRSKKAIRKAIRQQLQYIRRDIGHVKRMIETGKVLPQKGEEQLKVIEKIYEQ